MSSMTLLVWKLANGTSRFAGHIGHLSGQRMLVGENGPLFEMDHLFLRLVVPPLVPFFHILYPFSVLAVCYKITRTGIR